MTDLSEMVTDHEFIWLQPKCCAGEFDGRQWCQDNVFDDGECEDGAKATKYVRADLLERLTADIARMGEALRELVSVCEGLDFNSFTGGGWLRVSKARAALQESGQ